MNILMCANEFAYYGLEVAVYSLLKHNKDINLTVFTTSVLIDDNNGTVHDFKGMNEYQIKKLKKIVTYFDPNSKVDIVDISAIYNDFLAGNLNEGTSFSPHSMMRLLADLHFPPAIEDLMYLDSDVIVNADISADYYQYTHSDNAYSAYIIPDACCWQGEMNSGVIFFNMKKCREIRFFERARMNLDKNRYKFPDQMAMRDVCTAGQIDPSLNFMYKLHKAVGLPKIIHFTNELEPKAYNEDGGQDYFFQVYPQFNYIESGLKIIDSLNIKVD